MKKIIQGKRVVTLALLFRLIFSGAVYGSHTMGADLTYECLGGNTYKITVSFYRDCIGVAAPANPFVNINSPSCSQSLGVTCYPRPGTGLEVTPSCSSTVTTCNGGPFTGIQEWIYDGIVTLPANCTDWIFGYSLCCRNAAITTINTPSTNTFYIYATLNNTITPHNSSPTFSNKPVPFLCVGQQFCFNHGAYDADGDSLVYSLITPKQTASTSVTYHAPYSSSNPLNSLPTTSFNSSTGDFCLTPQALEVTVMAVLVSEYRNGVLIGSVERDLQLTVMNCANNLPSLTGINGTNQFSMTVCANQQTCFNILSIDPDGGQQLTVDWNYGIPGATFTSSSGAHPTGTFCWTPGTSAIGNSYTFTATVTDDACPYNGSQTYSYTINVVGINVNAGPDQAIACSDLATISAIASGGSGSYTYLWSNGSTMQAITVGAGTYWVTANDGSCTATDTVTITTPFIPVAAFTTSSPNCINQPVSFTDQSTTSGGAINYWHWTFGDGDSSLIQNPVHTYPGSGTYNVTLIVENTLGCRDTITIPIVIGAPPVTEFTWGTTCVNTTVNFTDQSTGTPVNWNWAFGDGTFSTQQNPSHVYTTAGNYTVILISGNATGCLDTATHIITVHPLPVANAGSDQTTCSGSSVTLTASGGLTYTWTPGGQTNPTITITPSGSTTVVVTVVDANGCIDNDSVNVIVNPLPVVSAGTDQTICNGSSVTLNASGANTYSWNPGGSTSSSITVTPGSGTVYIVTGTDLNGCTSTDAVSVNILPLPVANAGPDVDICSTPGITLNATGGVSYIWSPGGQTNQSILVNPSSTQTYQVTVTDANGCTDTDDVTLTVHQIPTINLQSAFLCAGTSSVLDAGNPGSDFLWSTGDTTQTIVITTGGIYSVVVTDNFGCSASASCLINYGTSITINLGNLAFCQGDTVTLDAGYTGMSYIWTPGGQTTQTISVSTAGTYGVTVTDGLGCSGSINVSAVVNPLPVADFSSITTCLGSAMNFTDGSSVVSGSITGWQWDFGDGTSSSLQNPSHTYATAGTFNVSLVVTTAGGCTASVSHNATVNPLPVTNFTYSNSCLGTAVTFTDQSTISSGNITSYNWILGDGSTSTQQNPVRTYASAGNYTVILNVTTSGGCSQSINHTVTIHPIPVAAFSATTVCLGRPTWFTNGSTIPTGIITNVSYDFNDTYTSSLTNPSHIYSTAGNYTVVQTVTSSYGCTNTISHNVTVNALPVANAGADQPLCRGSFATLSATGGVSYTWNPGAITGSPISVSPSTTSTYTVIVTDANGCTATDAATVIVNPIPNAQAGADQSTCSGNIVTLNGTGGISYLWTPGGMTSSGVNVNPTSTTNYILSVTDANGCTDNDTVRVTVNDLPVVSAGPDMNICVGSTTSLSASGAVSYQWNPIGMSTATILVTPPSNSTYIVIGTDAFGCISSDTVSVNVNPVPIINLYPTFICSGTTTTLDAGNTGSAYTWSTGETTQTISVSDSGEYTVLVISPNGCPAFAITDVTVGGSLNASPTNYSVCAGQSATLNAGNPGCTYQWSTGQTIQSINTSTAGTYNVTITDGNGCSATLAHIVNVNPLPTPLFLLTPVCFGNAVTFNDFSTVSSGIIQSVLWDFGDSYTSSSSSTSHNYAATGSYPVTLTVTTAAGCTSSLSRHANVNPLPVADFSTIPTCQNTTLSYNDLSSISAGTIASWNWIFGDGTSSTSPIPTHNYSASGNYSTQLIVTSNSGCKDTVTRSVTILELPAVSFTGANNCAQSLISFVNNTSSVNSPVTSYQWNFGNGNTSTAFQPSVQYTTAGTFAVQLIVSTANGCVDTATNVVSIYPLPIANFAATNVCSNSPVSLQNNSTISSGSIQNYYWNFGDATSATVMTPVHTYNTAGSYQMSLIVTSALGCRDSITHTIDIYPLPQPAFTGQDVCYGNDISFVNNSTVSTGSISSYSWNFNDGSVSNLSAPVHHYTASGTYSVNLTAVTDQGCTANISTSVNVFPVPVASFTTADVCMGTTTQFVNQSIIYGGGNLNSAWSYSDGDSSSDYNPLHQFPNGGNYSVNLIITSDNGCTDQITQNVDIFHLPNARFAAPDECSGTSVPFTNQSTSQDGNITSSMWGFGDGSYSFEINPVHTYADSGKYSVDLVVVSSYGCLGNYNDTVEAYSHPVVAIQMNNACAGSPVQFSGSTNQNGGQTYLWSLGNGSSSSMPAFNYTYNNPGNYNITLTATSAMGCSGTTTNQLVIHPIPVPAFVSNEVCQNSQTYFSNNTTILSGSVNSYAWNFGDSHQSNQFNPSHTYAAPGTYNATLAVVSNHGCASNTMRLVEVHPNPSVNFNSGLQGCGPLDAGFADLSTVSSGTIAGWLWNFGDGDVSTDANPHHVFNEPGSYDVTLSVVSDFGCMSSSSAANSIIVYPGPLADFTADPLVTDIESPIVHFQNLSQAYASYQWQFGDGTGTSSELNPTHTFGDTGTYSAMLITINNYGCRDTILKTIEIKLHSTLFIANCFTPNGDGNNDDFRPYYTNMENIQVWIFDRWGKLLTSWDGLEGSWNGYYQGRKCQSDTYVYKIAGTGIDGRRSEWIGHVSIVY